MKLAVAACLAVGCADTSDVLYQPESHAPNEVSSVLVRLTHNPRGDFVRAVTPDGQVRYVAHGLQGVGGDTLVRAMTIDPAGGTARVEGGAYSAVIPGVIPDLYVETDVRRALFATLPPVPLDSWCGNDSFEAPAPPFAGWRIYVLPESDGPALSSLPRIDRRLPIFATVGFAPNGGVLSPKRVRILPPVREADELGTNPWGPAVTQDGRFAYISDADSVRRYDLANPSDPPVVITAGSYPVLTTDESELLVARATISDSASVTSVVFYGLASCVQTFVYFSTSGWTIVRHDLESGAESTLGAGTDMALMGDSALVVRSDAGLEILRISDGTRTLLSPDQDASSPAVAPDASFVAFTTSRFGNPEVVVLYLN